MLAVLNPKKRNFFFQDQKILFSGNVEIRRFRTGTFLKKNDLVFFTSEPVAGDQFLTAVTCILRSRKNHFFFFEEKNL